MPSLLEMLLLLDWLGGFCSRRLHNIDHAAEQQQRRRRVRAAAEQRARGALRTVIQQPGRRGVGARWAGTLDI